MRDICKAILESDKPVKVIMGGVGRYRFWELWMRRIIDLYWEPDAEKRRELQEKYLKELDKLT